MGMLIRRERVRAVERAFIVATDCTGWISAMSSGNLLVMEQTGEISVRFYGAPSDTELAGFAAEHGLRLLRRNSFVPQQAVFQPLSSRSELGEVVRRIECEGAARSVWANTLSAPQRS
jgi:hypothetical protein